MRLLYDRFSSRERVQGTLVLTELIGIGTAVVFATGATRASGGGLWVLLAWAVMPRLLARCVESWGSAPTSPIALLTGTGALLVVGGAVLSQIAPVWGALGVTGLTTVISLWAISALLFDARLYRFFDLALLATVIGGLAARQPGAWWAVPVVLITLSISMTLRHLLFDVYVEKTPAPLNVQSSQAMGWLGGGAASVVFLVLTVLLWWVEPAPAMAKPSDGGPSVAQGEPEPETPSPDNGDRSEESEASGGSETASVEADSSESASNEEGESEEEGGSESSDETAGIGSEPAQEDAGDETAEADTEEAAGTGSITEGGVVAGAKSGAAVESEGADALTETAAPSPLILPLSEGPTDRDPAPDPEAPPDPNRSTDPSDPLFRLKGYGVEEFDENIEKPNLGKGARGRASPNSGATGESDPGSGDTPSGVSSSGGGSTTSHSGVAGPRTTGTPQRGSGNVGSANRPISTVPGGLSKSEPETLDVDELPEDVRVPLRPKEGLSEGDAEEDGGGPAGESDGLDAGTEAGAVEAATVDRGESAPAIEPDLSFLRDRGSRGSGVTDLETLLAEAGETPTDFGTLPTGTEAREIPKPAEEGESGGGSGEEGGDKNGDTPLAVRWLLGVAALAFAFLAARTFRRAESPARDRAPRGGGGGVSIVPLAAADPHVVPIPSTPAEAVLIAYDELQTSLARGRLHRRGHETPREQEQRLVYSREELTGPFRLVVGRVYDVLYGEESVEPTEVDEVRSSCDVIRRRLG